MSDDEPSFQATEFTVSANETVSTGDYESAEYYASVTVEVTGDVDIGEVRAEYRRRLAQLQHDVESAAEDRHRIKDHREFGESADGDV